MSLLLAFGIASLMQFAAMPDNCSHDHSGTGRSGTAHIIVDPLGQTISAPPKPAAPIVSLPDDQLVTRAAHYRG